MKIELKRESKLSAKNGIYEQYWIEVDGKYIQDSVCESLEEAQVKYHYIKSLNGGVQLTETIKSETI